MDETNAFSSATRNRQNPRHASAQADTEKGVSIVPRQVEEPPYRGQFMAWCRADTTSKVFYRGAHGPEPWLFVTLGAWCRSIQLVVNKRKCLSHKLTGSQVTVPKFFLIFIFLVISSWYAIASSILFLLRFFFLKKKKQNSVFKLIPKFRQMEINSYSW